ncbi:MAG: formyltransferase family protein, partial [Azonexus sp.]
MKNIVILISGRGSNMEALVAARDAGTLPVNIAAVISNRPAAQGLETAEKAGITAHYIDHKAFAERDAFDAALAECIDGFVRHYAGRLKNIHPSLLPAFPGLHTHRRALEEGVRIHGCTVHFVTPALDHGP